MEKALSLIRKEWEKKVNKERKDITSKCTKKLIDKNKKEEIIERD